MKMSGKREMEENKFDVITTDAWASRGPEDSNGVFGVDWSVANIGFGRLELFLDKDGKAHICSEHMDSNEDKSFTKAILMKVIEDAVVED